MRLPKFFLAASLLVAAVAHAAEIPGFTLDGTKWTYRDGAFSVNGILLKPEGNGPFPAIVISHGRGGNAEGFGMAKARDFVKMGFVCIATTYTHAGLHGSADTTVPSESSVRFKEALDRQKVPNERHVFDGIGHNLHQQKAEEVNALMRAWFVKFGVLEK